MRPMGTSGLAKRWHDLPIRYKCALVVALPVACLLFEIAWQARVLNSLEDAQRWASHTQEVELTVTKLEHLLSLIESNDRGYALTGRTEFLQSLQQQYKEVPEIARHLCYLVQDNPLQLARARNLVALSTAKLQVARDVVTYFSFRPYSPASAPVTAELSLRLMASKESMDQFSEQSAVFRKEEEKLLAERLERLQSERTFAQQVLVSSLVGGLIMGLGALQLFSYTVARRLSLLEAASRRLARGEIIPAPQAGKDEVSSLAWAIHSASHKINEQMQGLESLNRDLESFSYSVSHDLRSPLRHIHGFSKILTADFSAELPTEARRYLSRIESGAERMGHLIDDLLNFSRIGRRELDRQPVALFAIVEGIAEELNEGAVRTIEWRIQPLPTIKGDPALVKQVFVNLLSNAAKFTRTRERPVIEVGSRVLPQGTAIYVRDNGVGFDIKFADKLFGVFQRLHRLEDFEGTGVGLATVARIVRKHGGAIWADSALEQGATFYFTLDGSPAPNAIDHHKVESQTEVVYAAAR
jgi:signal transduction histidine kinase